MRTLEQILNSILGPESVGELEQKKQDLLRLYLKSQKALVQKSNEISELRNEIKRWDDRKIRAAAAHREDLASGAAERINDLMKSGRKKWSIALKTLQLIKDLKTQIAQVDAAINEAKCAPPSRKRGNRRSNDPLETAFDEFELEQDLKNMRKQV